MRHRDLIAIIEAVYRVDVPEPDWVAGLHDATHASMDRGLGTVAFLYDASCVPVRVWSTTERALAIPVEAVVATVATLNEKYVDRIARRLFVGAASEGPGFSKQEGVRNLMHPRGVRDAIAVNAYDASGIGAYLGALLPQVTKIDKRRRTDLERVAGHMASALGLRVRLGTSRIEAVLTPRGRVEHTEVETRDKDVRDVLREATLAIERARGVLRRDDRAIEMWRPRISARWTLVDQVDSDGKRFVVARANELPQKGIHPLSRREEHVLSLLATGRTSKAVAYELGIAPSTVRVLLRRAAQKLGAPSTARAVEAYRRLARAGSSSMAFSTSSSNTLERPRDQVPREVSNRQRPHR